MKANLVSCALMADNPPCSAVTCPEMRASEWQYLCAVHEPPKSCCAIDYVNHTLDWAANVLTSSKHFPSRLQLGGETGNVFQSMRQLTNIFRRVYRIFAHAWFQHREVFWHIESTYGIYMLFKSVCDKYQLIPEDNYTVPPEAEGLRDETDLETPVNTTSPDNSRGVQILRKDTHQPSLGENESDQSSSTEAAATASTAATARRHKHTPSTGSHVATIAEGEEDDDQASQTTALPILASSPPKQQNISPQRQTPHSLGRLDIANTVPAYVLSNPSDPTPTTATSDKDPMSAAKAFQNSEKSTEDEASSSASPKKSSSQQTSPERKLNTNVKPRRDSGFESEVRSPTGGSVRTAGPDILSAVLGHMSDEEDEDDEEGAKENKQSKEEDNESVMTDETVILSHDAKADQTEGSVGKEKSGSDDEDDNEQMEEIELPRASSKSPPVRDTGDDKAAEGTDAEKNTEGDAKTD